MSETRYTASRDVRTGEMSGWVGFIAFAGIMMIMSGAFQAIAGFVALFKEEYYAVPSQDLIVSVDYTTWGWVHLIIGAVLVLAGVGLVMGQMWARVVGVLVAFVSAVVNMAVIEAYPLWSLLIIALDVLIIYAIVAHGRELR